MKRLLIVAVLCVVAPVGRHVQGEAPSAQAAAAPPRAVFDKYCITCHNQH